MKSRHVPGLPVTWGSLRTWTIAIILKFSGASTKKVPWWKCGNSFRIWVLFAEIPPFKSGTTTVYEGAYASNEIVFQPVCSPCTDSSGVVRSLMDAETRIQNCISKNCIFSRNLKIKLTYVHKIRIHMILRLNHRIRAQKIATTSWVVHTQIFESKNCKQYCTELLHLLPFLNFRLLRSRFQVYNWISVLIFIVKLLHLLSLVHNSWGFW